MKYTEEMLLRSDSGFAMPFREQEGLEEKEVECRLGYGEHADAVTGETVFHHGVDIVANHARLEALATGTVSGVGSDSVDGIFQTIRYGKYEVTYRNLVAIYVNFGQPVVAGQAVSMCGDHLHIEVMFDGQEMDPMEFLVMLYGNVTAMSGDGRSIDTQRQNDTPIPTDYESQRGEIESLLLRFLPRYFSDISSGRYKVPERTEQSLRNIFAVGAEKKYYHETTPSLFNPLGLGQRAMELVRKVQNLLIADFLNCLLTCYDISPGMSSEEVKKNLTRTATAPAAM